MHKAQILVGVTRLERAIPASQMRCDTSFATPRYIQFFVIFSICGILCDRCLIIAHFKEERGKSAVSKAFLRVWKKDLDVSGNTPKPPALPTAPHLEAFNFRSVFSRDSIKPYLLILLFVLYQIFTGKSIRNHGKGGKRKMRYYDPSLLLFLAPSKSAMLPRKDAFCVVFCSFMCRKQVRLSHQAEHADSVQYRILNRIPLQQQ